MSREGGERGDWLEFVAKCALYPLTLVGIAGFIVSNLHAYTTRYGPIGTWLFFGLGMIWLISAVYIGSKDLSKSNPRRRRH